MNEEEVTYTEGGFSVKDPFWTIATAIDVAATALCGGAAASALGWLINGGFSKLVGKLVSGSGVVAKSCKVLLSNGFSEFLNSKMGITGFVLGFTSVGGFITNMWDIFDNSQIDGYTKVKLF
jgi:hypothetical protein